MKTKAVVLAGIKKPLEIRELTIPELMSGQVLVKIKAAGLCRTQFNEWQGLKGDDPYIPHLMGHEASGVVEKVAEGVSKVKTGDTVVVSWIKGSGKDAPGAKYIDENGVLVNSGAAAVFTQYAVVSENRVTPIEQKIPSKIAALFGCAIPTGVGVVFNNLAVKTGQSVAIFGVGGVGGAAILGAKAAGCKKIIAVDITKEKLELAKKLGATHVISNVDIDIMAAIHSIVPNGVDAAVEATGIASIGEKAFNALNSNGRLAIAGHPTVGSKMTIDPFMLIQGRSIVGSWGGDVDPDVDMPKYATAYSRGELAIDHLITHEYELDEINDALEMLQSGNAGRIILKMAS